MTIDNTPFGTNDVRPYDEADDTQGHAKRFAEPSTDRRPPNMGAEVEDAEGHAKRFAEPSADRKPPIAGAEVEDTEGHRVSRMAPVRQKSDEADDTEGHRFINP